ncbi:hypothetical protein G1H11_16125 [Phytoactinopolyspora alkaliphila]|uniref:Uncharacterized protein n=1 Tax=Phytoactinopolyspora alkaliphila TaxID=1783498 RepID=A0A6N9YPG8_9ACTN|nr:hypothetical protein [Phytoactinopolyspora alkaliphila]NED96835.1 hypothetical protein [Phytoactinopolyspora alkaliphila]
MFGRDEEVRAITAAPQRVTLLVGDSGFGKSIVPDAAQDLRSDAVAPGPVQLRDAPAYAHGTTAFFERYFGLAKRGSVT